MKISISIDPIDASSCVQQRIERSRSCERIKSAGAVIVQIRYFRLRFDLQLTWKGISLIKTFSGLQLLEMSESE